MVQEIYVVVQHDECPTRVLRTRKVPGMWSSGAPRGCHPAHVRGLGGSRGCAAPRPGRGRRSERGACGDLAEKLERHKQWGKQRTALGEALLL